MGDRIIITTGDMALYETYRAIYDSKTEADLLGKSWVVVHLSAVCIDQQWTFTVTLRETNPALWPTPKELIA